MQDVVKLATTTQGSLGDVWAHAEPSLTVTILRLKVELGHVHGMHVGWKKVQEQNVGASRYAHCAFSRNHATCVEPCRASTDACASTGEMHTAVYTIATEATPYLNETSSFPVASIFKHATVITYQCRNTVYAQHNGGQVM